MLGEGLKELIDSADAVAFDIFDTLITRPFMRPDHLFHFMEGKYRANGFGKKRTAAERKARRTIRSEVNLDEIYSVLAPGFPYMRERELEEELFFSVPDPWMKECWDYAQSTGKPIILVSDMYLPSGHIGRMLEKCGYTGYSRMYVSNEHSAGKCDGSLYRIILSDLGVEPSSLLMVGDNRHSDVSVPERMGIRTFRWIPMKERYGARHPMEYRMASHDPRISLLAGLDMMFDKDDEDYWNGIGRRFAGPLAAAFGSFIKKHEGDSERLVFCSRDGYMAMKAYEALGGGKDHTYLYTSRYLTSIFSGTGLESDRDIELISDYLEHTHEGEFGFDIHDPEQVKANRKCIIAAIEKDSRDYGIYVRRTVGDSANTLLIDSTTLRFTAQRDIEKIIGRSVSGCYYTVSKKGDVDYKAYAERNGEHLTWSYVNLSEYFLSSDEPPVRGFVDGEVVMMEPTMHEKERIAHCPELQEGMLDYIEDFKHFFGDDPPIFDHRSIDRWLDVLVENEKLDEGPLWRTRWPSDITNTEYADLLFRPRDILVWAKCTVGSFIKR